jgi:hypothetical protein
MIRWFIDLLYGAAPAEFDSDFGLEESVQRLRAATECSVFASLARQTAFGTVRDDRVSLYRSNALSYPATRHYFIGKFHRLGGRVVLSGQFTMRWWGKAICTFWLACGLLWTIFTIPTAVRDPDAWYLPLFGIGIFAVGAGLIWVGKWISRKDIPWLSVFIENALLKEPPNSRQNGGAPQGERV